MNELTPEHKLLCDVAAMKAHLDKYNRIEQRRLLGRVMEHLSAVVASQTVANYPAICESDQALTDVSNSSGDRKPNASSPGGSAPSQRLPE